MAVDPATGHAGGRQPARRRPARGTSRLAGRGGDRARPRDLEHRSSSPGRRRPAARLSGAGGGCPLPTSPRSVRCWRMITAPPVLPELPDALPLPERGTGERQRRRQARRRLARQQRLVVVLITLALAITVAILGRQWLDSAGTGTTTGAATSISIGAPT